MAGGHIEGGGMVGLGTGRGGMRGGGQGSSPLPLPLLSMPQQWGARGVFQTNFH